MNPDAKTDDVSETTESECGTIGTQGGGSSSYGGSTQDLVALLGLPSAEFLFEDRFRVDRRKLEHMILGDTDSQEPADIFFQKIMNETTTHITWPCRLKIGAKSKKDPHIRIAGRQEDVQAAKAMVKTVLDIKSNRVTMKMDISYTAHSHIIGRGGLTIKRVMEETGCHIHFPDSNRNNDAEKSNQVSIAGELKGVEQARARLRKLTPLIFSFELPIMGTVQSLPDPNSPVLKSIQEKYNVQIMFRTRPKLYGTQVIVKGCEWNVDQVKEATLKLIAHMCDSVANQVVVQMTLEISPHHHSIVLGKDCCNLKSIMQRTGAQIMFSDACDPNIPSLKKNNVSITGGIHSIYLARQQLLGSLPLVLMLDLPEDTEVDTEKISHIMHILDVYINVRHKPKHDLVSVIIKGIERNAANIYEARKQLLGLDEPVPPADIPSTYNILNASKVYSNDAFEKQKCLSPLTVNTGSVGVPPIMQPLQGPVTPPFIFPSKGHHLLNNPWSNGQSGPFHSPSPPISAVPIPVVQNPLNQFCNAHQVWLQQMGPPMLQRMNSNSSYGSSHLQLPSFHNSSINSNHRDNSGSVYSSLSSITSTLSSPSLSPRLDIPSGLHNGVTEDSSHIKVGNFMPDLRECQDRRAPGFEKKCLERAAQQGHLAFDFENKRLLAFQAMQNKPVGGDLRVPSGTWMGYGLSQSSPTPELEKNFKECFAASLKNDTLGDTWSSSPQSILPSTSNESEAKLSGSSLSTSNYLDSTPTAVKKKVMGMQFNDLVVLLASLGLEKYINNFKSHEIDLATFSFLTDGDLREIGVKALGARRKLLFIISEMKRRQTHMHGNIPLGDPSTSALATSSHFSSDWKQSNI